MFKVKCEICEREITKNNFKKHRCDKKQPHNVSEKTFPNCQFCHKKFDTKNQYKNHVIRCTANNDKIKSSFLEYFKRYGNSHSEETKLKLSLSAKKYYENNAVSKETREKIGQKSREHYKNPEARLKQSIAMKKAVLRNPDSYSKNNVSGRVKNIDYNGIILKGSWELLFAQFLDKNQIKWKQVDAPIPYFWNDGWHVYFPDFYLIEQDMFVEVKGYQTARDLAKWAAVENLLTIKQKEITLIKHGKFNLSDYINSKVLVP